MKSTGTRTKQDRLTLSLNVQDLSKDFVLEWGQSTRRTDGQTVITADPIDAVQGDGGQGFLLTVYNGFPPSDEVHGLPWRLSDSQNTVRLGLTDRRGQAVVGCLAKGTYYLSFESVAGKPLIAKIHGTNFTMAAAATTKREQEFHSADGTIGAKLLPNMKNSGRFMLEVDLKREAIAPGRLISFRITRKDGQVIAAGYVGLFDVNDEYFYGEIDLDTFTDNTIRSQIDPERFGDPYVSLIPQSVDDLVRANARMRGQICDELRQSIRATLDGRSRYALEDAMGKISAQGGDSEPITR